MALHPRSAAAWNLEGLIQDAQRHFKGGERAFETALRLAPSVATYNNLGNHFVLTGQPGKAERAYRSALRLDPHHLSSRISLIALLLKPCLSSDTVADRFADRERGAASKRVSACGGQALPLFAGFSTQDLALPEVEYLRVKALLAAGQTDKALQTARGAMERSPNDPKLSYSVGMAFLQAGDPASAIPFLEHTKRLSSSVNPELLLALATAEFGAHHPARSSFLRVSQLRPDWWQPYYYLGRLADEDKQYLQASFWLVKAEKLAPTEPLIAAALANVCEKQEFWLDALDEWQRYLKLRPRDTRAYLELAIAADMGGSQDLAMKAMTRYLAAFPGDAEGQYLMALIDLDSGRPGEALDALHISVRLLPRNVAAWTTLGDEAMKRNGFAKAMSDFKQALAVNSRYAPALVGQARVYDAEGRPDLALPLLIHATTLDPRNALAYYWLAHVYERTGNQAQSRHAAAMFERLRDPSSQSIGGRGLLSYIRTTVQLTPEERERHYREFLEAALKARPDDPRLLCRLGVAELSDGPSAPALAMLHRALVPSLPYADALATARSLESGAHKELALDFYNLALRKPEALTDARAALGKARFFIQSGDSLAALNVLSAIPAAAAPRGEAADLAGFVYSRLGKDPQALAAFRVAVQLDPHQEAFYRDAAVFLASRGRWEDASKLLDAGRSRCPGAPALDLTEAILLQLSGKSSQAQQTLSHLSINLSQPWLAPDQRLAGLLLGVSYYVNGKIPQASRLFQQLTLSDPKLALAWYYRALIASEGGHATEALAWVDRSLELNSHYAPALYLRGKIFKGSGQLVRAGQDLDAAAAADPGWSAPHYLLGQIYFTQGDTVRASKEQALVQQLDAHAQGSQSANLRAFLDQSIFPAKAD